ERARPELHAALEPADDAVPGEHGGGFQRDVLHPAVLEARALEEGLDLLVAEARPPERMVHLPAPRAARVAGGSAALSAAAGLPVAPERRAERRAGVAGRGLHPDALEGPRVADARVHHAVERHAACHAEVRASGRVPEIGSELDGRLLQHPLQRAGDVEMPARELGAAASRGTEAL